MSFNEIYDVYSIIESDKGYISEKDKEKLQYNYCLYVNEPFIRGKKPKNDMNVNQFIQMIVDLQMFDEEKVLSIFSLFY